MKDIMIGLMILESYDQTADFSAEEGRIWVGPYKSRENMTRIEIERLEQLGWEENAGRWSHVCSKYYAKEEKS